MKLPSTATDLATCLIVATSPFELPGDVSAMDPSTIPKARRLSLPTALALRLAIQQAPYGVQIKSISILLYICNSCSFCFKLDRHMFDFAVLSQMPASDCVGL